MATLQKFKLLATQCAVAGSPTRSPSASPVIHLRRRKTLRMLLSRPQRRHGLPSHEIHGGGEEDPPKKKDARVRRKLKDLFVSSPPPVVRDRVSEKRDDERRDREEEEEEVEESQELGLRFLPAGNGSVGFGVGLVARRLGAGSLRPVMSSGFRYRFLRRAWRPVLVSIPE